MIGMFQSVITQVTGIRDKDEARDGLVVYDEKMKFGGCYLYLSKSILKWVVNTVVMNAS
jgi:hypothetical protein